MRVALPHTRSMTNVAQSWTLLGIIGTMATGILALVALSQANLKAYLGARFDAVDARINAVDATFETKIDGVDRRLDALDRDVQALSDRVFRDRP